MARIENTNLPLAAKGTNSVGVSLIRVLLCFLQGQKLFIHTVPGNIVDFWNSDFLKKSPLDLSSPWILFLYLLLCMNFFLGSFSCINFFLFFFPTPPPPPPHRFSNGPSLRKAWYSGYRSERNLCNCVKKSGKKKSGFQRGLNPWPRDYRYDALQTELWSSWRWEQVNCVFIRSRERNEC